MAVVPTACEIRIVDVLESSEGALELYTNEPALARKVVPGLLEFKLPAGFTRQEEQIIQAGAIGTTNLGVPSYGPITFKLDWYHEDDTHDELYNRGICQKSFSDMWIYARLNLTDRSQDIIFIPNDSHVDYGGAGAGAGLDVAKFDIPSVAVNTAAHYTVDGQMAQKARFIKTTTQLEDTGTQFTFTATTIVRTTGSWVDDGIKDKDKIYIDDTLALGLNFGKIVTVLGVPTPLVITVKEVGLLVVDTASATTWLRAGVQM